MNLTETYPAEAGSVPLARDAVCTLASGAGATASEMDSVRLAVSEALTNAVLHAYPEAAGELHVTAAVTGGELQVLVADDGEGLHAGGGSPGQGLGFALIALMSDTFTIAKRSGGGIEVRLGFKLSAEIPAGNGGRQLLGSRA
jgi:anti-sigma regulatory factor (Ser/Thr protein kinase)